jgi:glycosyltransferase involved in cell wall biosynthesis
LRTLLNSPAQCREMGSKGRRWVAEHLPWNVVGTQMARVYEEIVRNHGARQVSRTQIPVAP